MELPKLKKVTDEITSRKKKKILLLSDDLRMFSGVATMSREFVLGTMEHFDWVQIAGAIKHPEEGKIIDLSQDTRIQTGVSDAYLKLYPTSGYGSLELVREIMHLEKPDAILHFTDPRFWIWLYQGEHELRQHIPIYYYNIWDDLPDPMYNKQYYESCDLLMAISKQTYGINKRVLKNSNYTDWQIKYVPHGINSKSFYPINEGHSEYEALTKYRKKIFGNDDIDFVVGYNSRNIRRKNIPDLILAYKEFCDKLPKEKADKCALLMHTQAVDQNGTDLIEVVKNLCPQYKVYFSEQGINNHELNYFYNICDITANVTSNEGFGLAPAESVMAGTPIIVNVTGGLQDQCGFKLNGKYLTPDDYIEIGSLHNNRIWENNPNLTHGNWVIPVWPNNRSLKGSVPTPYIFDDTLQYEDIAQAIMEWYDTPSEKRTAFGQEGREYFTSSDSCLNSIDMCRLFVEYMSDGLTKWQPRNRYTFKKIKKDTSAENIRFVDARMPKEQPKQQEIVLPQLKKV